MKYYQIKNLVTSTKPQYSRFHKYLSKEENHWQKDYIYFVVIEIKIIIWGGSCIVFYVVCSSHARFFFINKIHFSLIKSFY